MKKAIIAALAAAIPLSAYCAPPSKCESLVHLWARERAYTAACGEKTGLEQMVADAQQQFRSMSKAKVDRIIAEELEDARKANMASHDDYCRDSRELFKQIAGRIGADQDGGQ